MGGETSTAQKQVEQQQAQNAAARQAMIQQQMGMQQQQQQNNQPGPGQPHPQFNQPPRQQQQMQAPPMQAPNQPQQQYAMMPNQNQQQQLGPPQGGAPQEFGAGPRERRGTMSRQQMNDQYNKFKETSVGLREKKDGELSNFYLKAFVDKHSIKTQVTRDGAATLGLKFKLDALAKGVVRINTCVTQQKNANNVPQMFYTPNQTNYVQEVRFDIGMGQDIDFGRVKFDLNYLVAFGLTQNIREYYPIIMSINYADKGKQYALINYGVFELDGENEIKGVKIDKQIVLIEGMPFEIKSIFGLGKEEGATEAEQAVGQDDDDEEACCKVCLFEEKDTLIMPCGHFCVCHDCGVQLQAKNPLCPMCRQHIGQLLPINRKK